MSFRSAVIFCSSSVMRASHSFSLASASFMQLMPMLYLAEVVR